MPSGKSTKSHLREGSQVSSLRFLSANPHKVAEVREILTEYSVEVTGVSRRIEEIQSEDVQRLVRDKAIKAFTILGRPVFVEHTGLELPALNGLPGGLTQIFWDKLQADAFCTLVNGLPSASATARTTIGYCDGRRLHLFQGEILGQIATEPRGPRDFQWDCVFIPVGETRTFAEMGTEKNGISMRRRALDTFGQHLRSQND